MLSRDQDTTVNASLPRLSALPTTPQATTPAPPLFPQTSPSTDLALEQLQKFASGGSDAQSPRTTNSGLPPVDELIERLNARLQKNPNDISGWRTLGWSQFNLQHYDEAAAAYAKAIQLFPNVADLHSLRGEALVQAANGTVTEESKQEFGAALKLDAKDLRARFFFGLAKAQAGDKASALDAWIEVANDAGTSETAIPTLRQRIADLAKELNVDPNQKLKRPLDMTTSGPAQQPRNRDIAATSAASPTLTRDRDIAGSPTNPPAPAQDRDIAAAASAPRSEAKPEASVPPSNPTDQTAMISGMVERLTNRLNQSPRDVEGWIMLIRSKLVLNDPQAAKEAFSRASKVFEQSAPERDRLIAAAKELGLNP
jgi:cytochrome c-type biogenesis protein CcmH